MGRIPTPTDTAGPLDWDVCVCVCVYIYIYTVYINMQTFTDIYSSHKHVHIFCTGGRVFYSSDSEKEIQNEKMASHWEIKWTTKLTLLKSSLTVQCRRTQVLLNDNTNETHRIIRWRLWGLYWENNKQVPISYKDERLQNRPNIMLISQCN